MKLGDSAGINRVVLRNRNIYLNKIGILEKDVISVQSVHKDNIEIVSKKDKGAFIPGTDGLITCQKGIYLAVTIADCLPVIIYDTGNEILSLLHCGWKGLEQNIIQKALIKLKENFSIDFKNLMAGIGPGIGGCHFQVKADLVKKFKSFPGALFTRQGRSYVDLKLVAQKQMLDAGIGHDSIEINPVCTYCQSDKYFSHRKDKSSPVQAMLFVAGMR